MSGPPRTSSESTFSRKIKTSHLSAKGIKSCMYTHQCPLPPKSASCVYLIYFKRHEDLVFLFLFLFTLFFFGSEKQRDCCLLTRAGKMSHLSKGKYVLSHTSVSLGEIKTVLIMTWGEREARFGLQTVPERADGVSTAESV